MFNVCSRPFEMTGHVLRLKFLGIKMIEMTIEHKNCRLVISYLTNPLKSSTFRIQSIVVDATVVI